MRSLSCGFLSHTRAGARAQPGNELVAQLPADEAPGSAAMLHYTWGTVFKDAGGAKVWEFDKRVYTEEKLQRIVRSAFGCGALVLVCGIITLAVLLQMSHMSRAALATAIAALHWLASWCQSCSFVLGAGAEDTAAAAVRRGPAAAGRQGRVAQAVRLPGGRGRADEPRDRAAAEAAAVRGGITPHIACGMRNVLPQLWQACGSSTWASTKHYLA